MDFNALNDSPTKTFIKLTNTATKQNFRNINELYTTQKSLTSLEVSLKKRQSRPLSSVRTTRDQSSISTRASVRSKQAYPNGEKQLEFWKMMTKHRDKYVSEVAVSKHLIN